MASIPFEYECDRESGFAPDPNEHKRVGYITKLDGFGLTQPAASDLTVAVPYSGTPHYSGIALAPPGSTPLRVTTVVGVLEKFTWGGGVGDPVTLDFWCSQQNAFTIKAQLQTALKTSIVKALGWWIIDYDQETKQWYEKSYPVSATAVTGLIAGKDNPALNVDLSPVPAKDGIDVNVYKVSISVAPGANQQYALRFANSAATPVAKEWGLIIGKLSPSAT